MADVMDALAALAPDERRRLQQFATAFERLDAGSYAMFAARPDASAVEAAQLDAIGRIPSSRRDAVKAAIKVFIDEATVAYSRRFALPDTVLLYQSLPDRAEDRVRFLASVERAVVGLILWDELDDEELATLIGPWGALIEGPN